MVNAEYSAPSAKVGTSAPSKSQSQAILLVVVLVVGAIAYLIYQVSRGIGTIGKDFAGITNGLGNSINGAVDSFDGALGSIESGFSNIKLPAIKFPNLGGGTTGASSINILAVAPKSPTSTVHLVPNASDASNGYVAIPVGISKAEMAVSLSNLEMFQKPASTINNVANTRFVKPEFMQKEYGLGYSGQDSGFGLIGTIGRKQLLFTKSQEG